MGFDQILSFLFVSVGAGGFGYLLSKTLDKRKLGSAVENAESIARKSREDADAITRDAEIKGKADNIKRKEALLAEMQKEKENLWEQLKRLEKKEDQVEERALDLQKRERLTDSLQKKLQGQKNEAEQRTLKLDEVLRDQEKKLLTITSLTREEAERKLFDNLDRTLSKKTNERFRRFEDNLKSSTEELSRRTLIMAIQRFAGGIATESTVSTVDIPNDDVKGRIIGREGRNIRAFEKLTGVDVIIDDTPGVVVVSAFDRVRREIARLALIKLIEDGRIHPARIEEIVQATEKEMEKQIQEAGRKAWEEANVAPLHDKLIQLLGRLEYRTSYSQNVLRHSLEVAHIAGMLAEEFGLDGKLARRCGLLHDIGKAADHEMEGGHPKVGAELARKYGETSPDVLHAIEGHHETLSIDRAYTVLVATADSISASRPGARRDSLERYVKRMGDLEGIATGFPGVEQAFAIQAGRELRVIVNSTQTSDEDAARICHEIVKGIENQLSYPGEIKVTLIRETRIIEVAK
ncbi:MAG: ribonuclease Y [Gemmataceae bacterium]|nr:ribonuclease Y [Gemmataceae bacterium]